MIIIQLKTKLEPYEELERDYGSYKQIARRCQATRAIDEGTKAVFENINEYHEYNNLLMAIMQEGRMILEKKQRKKRRKNPWTIPDK